MAAPDPVSRPLRELLADELLAIAARVEKAATDAERKMLAGQYGPRLEHLAERLKGDAPTPAPETPPAG